MALGKDYRGQDCNLARSLELLGERWTLLVVRDAIYGVRRFNDFLTRLNCPKAVLSERLGRLVEAGVLEKRPYRSSPPRHEYVITDAGAELWPVVYSLAVWGQRHLAGSCPRRFLHADCGTELDGTGACPKCGPVGVRDVEMIPGPDAIRDDPVSLALRGPRRLLEPVVTGE